MTLIPGQRLGSYEVVSALGAGGMGEVYRARDPRLEREVAIKALPPSLAQHPDRLARFEREARVLAALNHPHIATIYGLEDTGGGTSAIVMELVDGPTLAERLTAGALPPDEAVAIARQIATALEAAHERGVVHRDLKPANVKAPPDGRMGRGSNVDRGCCPRRVGGLHERGGSVRHRLRSRRGGNAGHRRSCLRKAFATSVRATTILAAPFFAGREAACRPDQRCGGPGLLGVRPAARHSTQDHLRRAQCVDCRLDS